MRAHRSIEAALLGVATAAWLLAAPAPAQAGCGCDHPPPAWAPVMPAFAPPGATIRIHAEDRKFEPGLSYQVRVGTLGLSLGAVRAQHRDYLEVEVPMLAEVGPAPIRVWRTKGLLGLRVVFDLRYGDDLFTVLPAYARVPVEEGIYESLLSIAAVAKDGTVLVPLDLSQVVDGTQFAFEFERYPLGFGPADVVFYNKDGVDLNLFTLEVEDPTERQWGSYYGWDVNEDAGLGGLVYQTKVIRSLDLDLSSDMLTYWRHEFHGYAAAHAPGGSHEVSAQGLHPDGSYHVDHDFVVLAIHGDLRGVVGLADDLLLPGAALVGLNVAVLPSEHPVEPEEVADRLWQTTDIILNY